MPRNKNYYDGFLEAKNEQKREKVKNTIKI